LGLLPPEALGGELCFDGVDDGEEGVPLLDDVSDGDDPLDEELSEDEEDEEDVRLSVR
jgi:hypothetical protein